MNLLLQYNSKVILFNTGLDLPCSNNLLFPSPLLLKSGENLLDFLLPYSMVIFGVVFIVVFSAIDTQFRQEYLYHIPVFSQ